MCGLFRDRRVIVVQHVRGDNEIGRRRVAGTQTATSREWRTPPLWGVADSAPYLHDGRADTLEGAIFAHDGEGAIARDRYRRLMPGARRALVGFLRALQAPEET